jgi:ubiquinone/menaquinone biosynthesis C-methylase UbiE
MTNLTSPTAVNNPGSRLPNYGYYFFVPYISMLAVFLGAGVTAMILGRHQESLPIYYLGIATAAYGVLTTIGWAMARYVIPGNRVMVARQIISELGLKGCEQILDVGSGRGLYAIEAARNLSTGRVIGIDIWDPAAIEKPGFHHHLSQPTGNTIENAKRNSLLAGVSDKIEFVNMDAAHLDFADNSFDVVICGFVIGHLWRYQHRVLKEIRRVTKNNGRLMIIDNARDLTYFFLSTPHMFVWSYLRGRKARRLSKQNWFNTIIHSKFQILQWQIKRGIIAVECEKKTR